MKIQAFHRSLPFVIFASLMSPALAAKLAPAEAAPDPAPATIRIAPARPAPDQPAPAQPGPGLVVRLVAPAVQAEEGQRPLIVDPRNMKAVRNNLIGFSDTLVFISFPEQHAVLSLRIDHTNQEFPVTGRVHLFAEDADAQNMDRWINNQHSCGLFMGVVDPVFNAPLPEDGLAVVERQHVGDAVGPNDPASYQDFRVKLAVAAHSVPGQYAMQAFELETNVYLKITTD